MELPAIRTVTIGIGQPHPVAPKLIEEAAGHARRAEEMYRDAGYEVQTVRLTTRPVFEDLADWPAADVFAYAGELQAALDSAGITYLSLGPAPAYRPDFPLDRLGPIAELLAAHPAVSCSVQLGTATHGVRAEAVAPTVAITRDLSTSTAGGVGNFRFAALANVGPGHPFFPASYHAGPDALTVGTQGAGVVAAALAGLDPVPAAVTAAARAALTEAATPVVRLAKRAASRARLRFGGIDLSPAPAGPVSIGAAFAAVLGRFGAPGTLAVAAALTEALRTTRVPRCGYNGLMLPVLEDEVLAAEWEAGRIGAAELLSYSAVCGTGLDTVPLPGDTPVADIAGMFLDVATLAVRLRKPLSARLFPVPGKRSGDRTAFGSPYLVDITLP